MFNILKSGCRNAGHCVTEEKRRRQVASIGQASLSHCYYSAAKKERERDNDVSNLVAETAPLYSHTLRTQTS